MIQFENAVKRFGAIILNELYDAKIDCWVAGGAVRDYFAGIPIKGDIDLFFPNQAMFDKADLFFKRNNAEVLWESDNGKKVKYGDRVFDLVKFFSPSPGECITAFDFTVSMFAVDQKNVYHGDTSFIDLAKRQLMLKDMRFPPSTLRRAFRYYKKGYTMCIEQMAILVKAIQEMPVENIPQEENENISSGRGLFVGFD